MVKNNQRLSLWIDILVAFIIGLIAVQVVLGLEKINPTDTSWLLLPGSDYSYHYLAWEYFKDTPWGWPLGSITGYAYPMSNSILYTDSIPLLALFFKLWRSVLPADFQYFGLWYTSCYVLNTFFGIKIIKHIGWPGLLSYVAAIFFTGAVVLVARFGHSALCGQWVILASLWLFIRRNEISQKKLFALGLLTVFATSLIHPYLLFMVLGLISAIGFQLKYEQRIEWKDLGFSLLAMCTLVILSWWLCGAFMFKGQLSEGLGRYSANLNTLVNAWDVGRWGPGFKYYGDGQGEGIAYLGLGILMLLVGLVIFKLKTVISSRPASLRRSASINWLFIVCMIFFVFALSPKWALGDNLLLDWGYNDYISRTFRGTGRFVWPFYYFIIYSVLDRWYHIKLPSQVKYTLIFTAVGLQMVDLEPLWKRNPYVDSKGQQLPYIDQIRHIISRSDQVIVYPAYTANIADFCDYIYFTDIAQHYRKPISTGYGARFPEAIGRTFKDSLSDLVQYFDKHPKNILITNADSLWVHQDLVSRQGGRSYQFEHYRIYAPPRLVSDIDSAVVPPITWQVMQRQSPISLSEVIHSHLHHFILGVVQQEGVSNLHSKDELKNMGALLDSVRFGDSWTFVIHQNRFIKQKFNHRTLVQDTFYLPCHPSSYPVYLASGGHSAGKNESSVLVEGHEQSVGRRGVNLVILDSCGLVLDKLNVDGYISDRFVWK